MVVELQAHEGRRGGSPRLGLTPVARESSVRHIMGDKSRVPIQLKTAIEVLPYVTGDEDVTG